MNCLVDLAGWIGLLFSSSNLLFFQLFFLQRNRRPRTLIDELKNEKAPPMNDRSERQKILIIDGNKPNQERLRDLFNGDYEISSALSAESGLEITRSNSPPDIVLSALLLPDMDGYGVCARLHEDESTRDIPVFLVAGDSEDVDPARGFALGAVDIITPPFHPDFIRARVDVYLKLRRKESLLEEWGSIDALTEIPNRRRFERQARKEWNRAMRSGQYMTLILMDIDHFEAFQDTRSSESGDECLRKVAWAIKETLKRAGDFVARYGKDKFAALLPYTQKDEALEIAAKLMESVESLNIVHQSSPVTGFITISQGVVTVNPDSCLPIEQITDTAEKALQNVKRKGGRLIEAVQLEQ